MPHESELSRLYEAERTARGRAETLQRVTATLARAQTMADVGRIFSRELATFLGADTAWVGIVTPDGTAIEALGACGYTPAAEAQWRSLPLTSDIAVVDVVRSGRSQWWGSRQELIAAYPQRAAAIEAADQESVTLLALVGETATLTPVPLVGPGEAEFGVGDHARSAAIIGAIVVGFRRTQLFDADTRAFYIALAQQCAQAIARARAYEAERSARERADIVRERTERLLTTSIALSHSMASYDIARIINRNGLDMFHADGSALYLLNDDGTALVLIGALGFSVEDLQQFERIPVDHATPVTEVVRTGIALFAQDRRTLEDRFPNLIDAIARTGRHAQTAVPLRVEGRVLGVLTFVFDEPRRFSGDDRIFIEVLAQQCAQVLERTRLFEAERDARARAEVLQSVTAALTAADSIPEVAAAALRAASHSSHAPSGAIALLSSDGAWLTNIAQVGLSPGALVQWERFESRGPYPAADVVASGRPQFLSNRGEYASRYPAVLATAEVLGIESSAILPLSRSHDGQPVGYLSLHYAEPRSFPPSEVAFLEALAQVTAQALERARLYEAEQFARADAEAARTAAELANQTKSQFLANMSHELRTPLNAIGGYAELMELGIHGPITEPQRTALLRIKRSQTHLLSLINEVLNYARLEAGVVQYNSTNVGVAGALASVEAFIQPQVDAKGIAFEITECEPSLQVLADEEKLSQVLLNLLSNALKFTDPGGRIAVSCVHVRTAIPEHVSITVTDTGIGIPDDQLDRVFEPFVQVGRTLSSQHEGTGLGLAISRDLARGMGGDLRAESTLGEGSTFTLLLRVPAT